MQYVETTKLIFTATLFILMSLSSSALAQDCGLENWDDNTDGNLSADEFEMALVDVDYFGTWDTDADGYLSEEEWNTGTDTYLVDYNVGVYADWDADADGQLTDEEFNEGVFNLADENDDNLIDGNDWNTFDVEGDGIFC